MTSRLALLLLLATACTQSAGPPESPQESAPAAAPPAVAKDQTAVGAAGESRGFQSITAPLPVADSLTPQMLIRTGDASIEVDSLEAAVAAVRQLASRAGGWVANTSYSGGRHQMREATLQLRIPANRFDEAQRGLDSIGTVEWMNVSAQDVGEEYVDLGARVANSRRLEARLVELLARRTGKLEDVLAVERELARVREEIERTEGRLRYLRTRVATSWNVTSRCDWRSRCRCASTRKHPSSPDGAASVSSGNPSARPGATSCTQPPPSSRRQASWCPCCCWA